MFVICKICWYLTKFEMFSLGQWTGTQSSVHRTICEWNGGKVPRTRQPTAKSSTDRWPQGKEQTVEECKYLENLDGNMSILVWKKLILSFSKSIDRKSCTCKMQTRRMRRPFRSSRRKSIQSMIVLHWKWIVHSVISIWIRHGRQKHQKLQLSPAKRTIHQQLWYWAHCECGIIRSTKHKS